MAGHPRGKTCLCPAVAAIVNSLLALVPRPLRGHQSLARANAIADSICCSYSRPSSPRTLILALLAFFTCFFF